MQTVDPVATTPTAMVRFLRGRYQTRHRPATTTAPSSHPTTISSSSHRGCLLICAYQCPRTAHPWAITRRTGRHSHIICHSHRVPTAAIETRGTCLSRAISIRTRPVPRPVLRSSTTLAPCRTVPARYCITVSRSHDRKACTGDE